MNVKTVCPIPHQWLSDFELKNGRREVSGSFLGRACRYSSSEFSVFFSKRKYGLGSLRKTPSHRGHPSVDPGPTCGQLTLTLQRKPTKELYLKEKKKQKHWRFSQISPPLYLFKIKIQKDNQNFHFQ